MKEEKVYKYSYKTPEGFSDMIMNSDGEYLTGLWFEGSRDSSKHVTDCEIKELDIFKQTCAWLDTYFEGKIQILYHNTKFTI